jgi:hypothetical protein
MFHLLTLLSLLQRYRYSLQTWFQFNDEEVTRIKSLGDKKRPSKAVDSMDVIDLVDDDEDEM